MSMYLKLGTSPAHLIAMAQSIAAKAEALNGDLGGLLANVEAHEADSVIGPKGDYFRDSFDKSYERDDGQGKSNEVTKQGVRDISEHAPTFGEGMTTTMVDYLTNDTASQADIESVL